MSQFDTSSDEQDNEPEQRLTAEQLKIATYFAIGLTLLVIAYTWSN